MLIAIMVAAGTLSVPAPALAKSWFIYHIYSDYESCDAIGEFLEDTGYVKNQDQWTCKWDSPLWALWVYH
ncbi:hypothetical protein [Streptosporangium subroseum]|uniref:hypothetical protein n=1 Tax=Streptosporangium subroseum TaxID=106412 RepID=UPI00308AED4B|nr:hypothetical protein OHB15_26790 [Streptosporangium subroseum]